MTEGRSASRGAEADGVIALHAEWLRVLDRLTGAPVGHAAPLTGAQRLDLVTRGRALERQIAMTRARSFAEVALKLKMAASGLLLTGHWEKLVASAACDLESPEPDSPLARPELRFRTTDPPRRTRM